MANDIEAAPTQRRGVLVGLAGLVVVAGVAAAIALSGGDGGDGRERVVADTPSEVIPMAATELPDGFELVAAQEISSSWLGADPPELSVDLYGDPEADRPFGEADLAIMVTRAARPLDAHVTDEGIASDLEMFDGHEIEVRGGDGYLADYALMVGVRSVSWIEDDGTELLVASRTLGDDRLVEIAEGLDLSDPGRPVPTDLPAGLAPVAEDGSTFGFGLGMAEGYSLTYGSSMPSPDAAEVEPNPQMEPIGMILVTITPGGPSTEMMVEWLSTADDADLSVRGAPAALQDLGGWSDEGEVEDLGGGSPLLSWVDPAGPAISLHGMGVSRDELLLVAESLEPLDEQEWVALQESRWRDDVTELGRGEGTNGLWRVSLAEADGSSTFCVEGGWGSNCYPMDLPTDPDRSDVIDEHRYHPSEGVVAGWVRPDVAEVAVEVDGEVLERSATIADPESRPVRYYALAAPWLEEPFVLVAFDERGQELHRQQADDLAAAMRRNAEIPVQAEPGGL